MGVKAKVEKVSKIEISIISKESWETYKSLRLTSLKESPDAFGSTYERESGFSKNQWISRITPEGSTSHILPLIVKYKGVPAGLAFGVVHKKEPNSAHLYQMWVSPNYRGKDIGKALLERISSWAKELQLEYLLLAVTTSNITAVNLYKSFGFVNIGEPEPLREGSHLVVQPMVLSLL